MSDFRTIAGFEDVWRPPVRLRRTTPETVLADHAGSQATRARLLRLVARTPEVMVKVTGRTRDAAHLAAHLSYITRNGDLAAEDRDGLSVMGRREVFEVAADWAAACEILSRSRANSPLSLGIILSMPAGTDALRLRDAGLAFARETFADRFDYLAVLHTDAAHPHLHLTVRALGHRGQRLNIKKADLQAWRETFARTLRERGVAAEATPRRTRGVTRKPDRPPVRRMLQRHVAGRGPLPRVRTDAFREAAKLAFGGQIALTLWEEALLKRRARVRGLYLAQARLLAQSDLAEDRELAPRVEAFVRNWPEADTQRLALARELRNINTRLIPFAEISKAGPERRR